MSNISPEDKERAKELLELMGEEGKKETNWTGIISLIFFITFVISYVMILGVGPIWLKVLATVYLIWRLVVSREKIKNIFNK
jgi:hypothetical protein